MSEPTKRCCGTCDHAVERRHMRADLAREAEYVGLDVACAHPNNLRDRVPLLPASSGCGRWEVRTWD